LAASGNGIAMLHIPGRPAHELHHPPIVGVVGASKSVIEQLPKRMFVPGSLSGDDAR
jgi:hypothetical protein